MCIKTTQTSNKNFILKYFRCRDGKRTETRIGMEGICITHSCIPLYTVYMQHIMAHSGGMQEWVIQIPSIPILVSVIFPSLHLKYFRIKFLLLVSFQAELFPALAGYKFTPSVAMTAKSATRRTGSGINTYCSSRFFVRADFHFLCLFK